ncbi:alpha/beta fold hydrolase [Angustibacter luteus]|uniref:Alpha/beta fold hydrolase n=1 Tax=Angustibacter luteus TaxID=658456 RepID=A0ABW1JF57_9ACTN
MDSQVDGQVASAPDGETVLLPDGRTAQLWQGGDPDGLPVLFFHGCPDTRRAAWSGAEAAQRAGVRLVAVNRPGYGLSTATAPGHPSGHASVADDTVAVADLLGIAGFAVLGMSIGGQYALACAARHPERVLAAGAIATPAVVPELDPPWHRDDLAPEQQAFVRRLAQVPVDDAIELMRPEFEAYVATVDPRDPDDAALAARWTAPLPPADAVLVAARPAAEVAASAREALAQTAGYLHDGAIAFRAWELRPELVQCPTWLWYGDLDDNAPPRNGRWLAEHIAGSTLVVHARTTHLATLVTRWDEILRTLRAAAPR